MRTTKTRIEGSVAGRMMAAIMMGFKRLKRAEIVERLMSGLRDDQAIPDDADDQVDDEMLDPEYGDGYDQGDDQS